MVANIMGPCTAVCMCGSPPGSCCGTAAGVAQAVTPGRGDTFGVSTVSFWRVLTGAWHTSAAGIVVGVTWVEEGIVVGVTWVERDRVFSRVRVVGRLQLTTGIHS